MKYKNLRTGVVIDTPDVISGGNWVLENDYKSSEDNHEQQEIVQEQEDIDVVDEKIEDTEVEEQSNSEQNNPEEITKAQIMQELDAFGIEYNPRDKKQVLYELMMNHEQ